MKEVCIIGFGFTAIPLVRELDATGTDYEIISDGDNVWTALNESERLDFDLVSNYLSSFYSFDLVKDFEKDYYPTSKEFYEMHKRWGKVYEDRITRDIVLRVDNYEDHSEIFTKSGKTVKARHVVFSTGFQRSIHSSLTDIDYKVTDKTFVLDTIGDSANLIISKLLPGNNKIIIRTKGFDPLDKVIPIAGITFTLDQLEFHNFRYVSQEHYSSIITGKTAGNPFVLSTQFPDTVRDMSHLTTKSTPRNGTIVIKYWPIDMYAKEFGDDLEENIAKGYLLNDISYWISTGRVVVVPKDSPIDFENKTIEYGGIKRSYHQHITGDAEKPRLPPIMINGSTPYEYHFRENFMGLIPKKLNNVYTIGFTRPMTGGVANISEMQCIFAHKLITQPAFRKEIRHNLEERIEKYNEHYYGTTPPTKSDHSVYYGFFTDDIARLMGIDFKPTECKTMKDLVFYYAFPNNAFKYRLKGEYAVEGIDKVIDKINEQYKDFIAIFAYVLTSNTRDSGEERSDWLKQQKRYFFNDMRPKEAFASFIEEYFEAFRKVKKVSVGEEIVDAEWQELVRICSKTRDEVLKETEDLGTVKWSEEIHKAADLVRSMAVNDLHEISGQSIEELQGHFALLADMKNPQEYDKPYLNASIGEAVDG
ncbi:MAG: thioredoxin reductase [Bacteroidota bacterium]